MGSLHDKAVARSTPSPLTRAIAGALVSMTRVLPLFVLAPLARAVVVLANRTRGIGGGSMSIEQEVRAAVRYLPETGAIVLDVGANKGEWTRSLLRQAGDRVEHVILFEPSVAHRDSLAPLAGDRCVHLPLAVGEAAGESMLYADFSGSGLGSLHRRRLDHFGLRHDPQHAVEVTTLDQVAQEQGISRVDFLKMDIEGNELAALRGARRLLGERRIRALSFEFGGANIDSRTYFQDFWYELTSKGFEILRILPGGRLLPVLEYTEELEAFVTTNYIAVLKDVGGAHETGEGLAP